MFVCLFVCWLVGWLVGCCCYCCWLVGWLVGWFFGGWGCRKLTHPVPHHNEFNLKKRSCVLWATFAVWSIGSLYKAVLFLSYGWHYNRDVYKHETSQKANFQTMDFIFAMIIINANPLYVQGSTQVLMADTFYMLLLESYLSIFFAVQTIAKSEKQLWTTDSSLDRWKTNTLHIDLFEVAAAN